jgi:hypothetical protein
MLILLLVLPFEIAGQGEWGLEKSYRIKFSWAGNLVAFSLGAQQGLHYQLLTIFGVTLWRGGGNDREKLKKSNSPKKKAAQRGKSSFSLLEAKRMITDRNLLEACKSFLSRMIKAFGVKLKAWGTYCTDDPALTGIMAGLLAAISNDKITLDLEPGFAEDDLDLKGRLNCRFIIAELLGISLTFLWQKQVRKYWWPILKAKFKNKYKFKEATQNV